MIGTFGDVVFSASDSLIRTFNEFRRSTSTRWAAHDVIGKRPIPEYIGPGLDTITFTMRFDVRYGVVPRREATRILEMCQSGKAEKLIVGGTAMGVSKWVIISIDQTWDYIDNKGVVLVSNVNVTMQEYW